MKSSNQNSNVKMPFTRRPQLILFILTACCVISMGYYYIKKENIGLIEVMGLAVLPSRLKKELFELADALVARTPVSQYPEELQKHAKWAEDILARHPELNGDTVHLILQDEVGHVFAQVLADAGVYKMDEAGRAGFVRFLASVQ